MQLSIGSREWKEIKIGMQFSFFCSSHVFLPSPPPQDKGFLRMGLIDVVLGKQRYKLYITRKHHIWKILHAYW